MKKLFIIIAIALSVYSCRHSANEDETKIMKENVIDLKEFITRSEQNILDSESIPDNWTERIKDENHIMIYAINSECSNCIIDYIRFLKIADQIKMDIHIYGIVNKDQEYVVQFYLNEYKVNQLENIQIDFIITDDLFPYRNSLRQNIFFLNGKKLAGKALFTNNRLYF